MSGLTGLERIAEAKLAEGAATGPFSGLRGEGRPLAHEDDSHVPAEWRLAFHVLRNAGIRPAWIELRSEIIAAAKAARARLNAVPPGDRRRPGAEARFVDEAQAINRRVSELNLSAPSPRWHLRPIDPRAECVAAPSPDGPSAG